MYLIDRLLEVTLPVENGRYGIVLWEAYFDESGDDGGFPIMTVGGYLVKPSNARRLERKWRRLLRKYKLPYFHMVECAHGNKNFKGRSIEERVEIQTAMFETINKYVEMSMATSVSLREFVSTEEVKDPYSHCVLHTYLVLSSILQKKDPNFKLSLFYESGHKHGPNALRVFNESPIPNSSFSFIDKAQSGMIQAADIFAWQYTKYIKDKAKKEPRKTRKDFEFLLGKPGVFYNTISCAEGVFQYIMFDGAVNNEETIDGLIDIFGDENEKRTDHMKSLSLDWSV